MATGRGLGLLAVTVVSACAGLALGQGPAGPYQGPAGPGVQAAASDPAMAPQEPTIRPRTPLYPALDHVPVGLGSGRPLAGPPAPQSPFVLSAEEMARLDQVLIAWEQRNKEIKSFECSFTRFGYDYVFGKRDPVTGQESPTRFRDEGILKYAAPDKGLYKVDGERSMEWKDTGPGAGQWQKFAGDRSEQWLCDGRSIFEYKYQVPKDEKKRRIEYPLPPERQGKAIADGPLPFVFGTDAQKLKERYFLRLTTPPDVKGEIWLEAFPRWQQDAAEYRKVDLILKVTGLLPDAIQITEPNGRDRKVYKFEDVAVNRRLRFLEPDWSKAPLPMGWKAIVEPPPGAAEANRAIRQR